MSANHPLRTLAHFDHGGPVSDFYRQSFVLEQVSPAKAIRYVCYEDLRSGRFCVSSGEVLTAPQDAETLSFHAVSQAEHFIAEGVSRWFDSLFEAVEDFAPVMENQRSA
jgi:hypothetical protein